MYSKEDRKQYFMSGNVKMIIYICQIFKHFVYICPRPTQRLADIHMSTQQVKFEGQVRLFPRASAQNADTSHEGGQLKHDANGLVSMETQNMDQQSTGPESSGKEHCKNR